jgi:DNA-binding transcriptional ArsR family regulator
LVQLAAAAQMLALSLAAAADRSGATLLQAPRLRVVGPDDPPDEQEESLAARTRSYLRARRLREDLFPEQIFADPAWDMLLELFACRLEGNRVHISDACAATLVPQTTALRWIDRLVECGLIERHRDTKDSRRIYVELSEIAAWRIELWLNAAFHPLLASYVTEPQSRGDECNPAARS